MPLPRARFTPEQADRTLPLVRRIVEDIVVHYRQWAERVRELELAMRSPPFGAGQPRAEQLQREVRALAEQIEGFEQELTDLGIEVKDYALGLIDFPSEINGRMVYLCWRLGEPSVRFWHEPETGYRGRRPLYPAVGPASGAGA